MNKRKIAMLHLLLNAGEIKTNQSLITQAVQKAAEKGAEWIITPELAVSGLQFTKECGIDWIQQQPNEWMSSLMEVAKSSAVNLFIGAPEKDPEGELFNSVFVINREGRLIGRQRKRSSVTDDWSSSGGHLEPLTIDHVKAGILICADSYTKENAVTLRDKGAEILIAPSSWGPGLHGPNGEWEARTIDTGLPMFVCNRTGEDETVTFWEAKSLVIEHGIHLLAHHSRESAILLFDWDFDKRELLSTEFEVEYII
ncbi:carbon-nitrogen hydrolase family protein [Alkalihalophilus pseudofirmus]|uniref:carbon-nitrogen hydrolase family protein n=1 Tax=Alkalihalophilus pseudofirmus TaxID=79885 RepID=UPI000952BDB9|nr:carbon-nitrogen hydrolase family protein [Alkalihalophilus pseudofirmus]